VSLSLAESRISYRHHSHLLLAIRSQNSPESARFVVGPGPQGLEALCHDQNLIANMGFTCFDGALMMVDTGGTTSYRTPSNKFRKSLVLVRNATLKGGVHPALDKENKPR
jgi:hypothetical protein